MSYEDIYNNLCCLAYNSLTSGLINEQTHRDFENYCYEFEQRFYKTKQINNEDKS